MSDRYGAAALPPGVTVETAVRELADRLSVPPYLHRFPVDEARQALLELQSGPVALAATDVVELLVPVGDSAVPVTLVRPPAEPALLPVVVYLHGGGGTVGSFATHERLVRELASRSGLMMAFPEYSLSPAVRHPVALLECHGLLGWLSAFGETVGADPRRILVAGDSTGATMATALAMLADAHGPRVLGQLLYYPLVRADARHLTGSPYADCPFLPRRALVLARRHLLGPGGDAADPLVSPLLAHSDRLAGLGAAMVVTAEVDVSRDDAEAYAARLADSGVAVEAVRMLGTVHHFVVADALRDTVAARLAVELGAEFLRRAAT